MSEANTVVVEGAQMFTCAPDCNVCNAVDYEVTDRKRWMSCVHPGDVVLDVGAHAGLFSVLSAHHGAVCHAFEAEERSYAALTKNSELYGIDKIHPYNVAVSNGNRPVNIMQRSFAMGWVTEVGDEPELNGMGHGAYGSIHQRTIQSVAIDTLFPDDFTVNMVKLDLEGSEVKAVEGMKGILTRSPKIFMMVEVSRPHLDLIGHTTPEALFNLLVSYGLRPLGFGIADVSTITGDRFMNLFFSKGC